MDDPDFFDARFRAAVGLFLEAACRTYGNDIPWKILSAGFSFDGEVVPLIGATGIWKPACLPQMPISITTAPVRAGGERPYADDFQDESHLSYRYRGTDPKHRDNVGLRLAMQRGVPLAYFQGTSKGWYSVVYPVFVVSEDPAAHSFLVVVDAIAESLPKEATGSDGIEARRAYVTRLTKQRLHQQVFRRRVLTAYQTQCSVCHLHRDRLLDAAHILPDNDPRGVPAVSNGLALCKLHHAAFDAYLLGVRPDHTIDLRLDLMTERDGPMLLHGLQGFHRQRITVPRDASKQPDPLFLAERYELFKNAG